MCPYGDRRSYSSHNKNLTYRYTNPSQMQYNTGKSKVPVVYDPSLDPMEPDVTHVTIEMSATPPAVLATYSAARIEDLPRLGEGMLTVSQRIALRMFDFKQETIEDHLI
jgi:hypothetical protein